MQVELGPSTLRGSCTTGEESRAYIAGEPANDVRFIPAFAHALEHTGSYAPEQAPRIAKPYRL